MLNSHPQLLTYQGFSHKKLSHRALQRSDQLRETFLSEISIYEPHMLVFVDETGCDRCTALRKYGYSLKGRPATADTLLEVFSNNCNDLWWYSRCAHYWWEHRWWHVLQLYWEVPTTPVAAIQWYQWKECGCNGQRVHSPHRATALVEEIGTIPLFLPPYSPDVMPIGVLFKGQKLANDPLIQILQESEIEGILGAFASLTPDDCYSWAEHCGYM